MELHLISGFLGSGKTTTIIKLCKYLMKNGNKVAVVTNDQGKFLVDTAFMKASDIPAVDVRSGCFCTRVDDLVEQLQELKKLIDPDIVFAESIGSSGNLVGTVMKPLLNDSEFTPTSLTALVDARLLLRLIRNEYLPFSDSVTATFMNQIIESDRLIINKMDLLSSDNIDEIKSGFFNLFGDKEFLLRSALSDKDIISTYDFINKSKSVFNEDLSFNGDLHQKALERLKWNEEVHVLENDKNVREDIEKIILKILSELKAIQSTIAHIKILIETPEKTTKLSITPLDENNWRHVINGIHSKRAKITINSRTQSF